MRLSNEDDKTTSCSFKERRRRYKKSCPCDDPFAGFLNLIFHCGDGADILPY
jgi:hypothetical protein